jgi:tetratricopeptide (TPR) repeat protein
MKARNFVIVVFIVLAGMTLVAAWDPIYDIAIDVFNTIVKWAVSGILESVNALVTALIEAYKNVLLWNPDPADSKPLADDITRMLIPVYVIAIMITGFYWLFLSISPRSRAQAKGMLLKLLISMPLVMASTALFQLMLDISSLCVNFIFTLATVDISMFSVLVVAGISAIIIGSGGVATPVIVNILLILLLSIFTVSVVRYMALLFMAAISPLVIFLYLFDLTKDTGSMLLRYTLMFAFVPVLQAFFIVFTITALNSGIDYNSINSLGGATTALAATMAQFGIIAGSFTLIILSPFIMLDLMEWLGLSMVAWVFGNQSALRERGWGQLGNMTMLTGALLAGEGAGALPLAGTLMFLDKLSPHEPDQHHQISEAGRRYWDKQYGAGSGSPGGGGGWGGGPKSGRKKFSSKKGPEPNIVEANTTKEHWDNAKEYAKAGKHDEALKSYNKALDSDASSNPDRGDKLGMKEKRAIYTEMGEAYAKKAEKATKPDERMSNLDKAMEANRRAESQISSSTPEADKAKLAQSYSRIAASYEQSKNIEQAANAYKRAVDLDPSKPEYALKYADVLFKKG